MLHPGQQIHIVGIGGFGMSAIARVLVQRGYVVSGSDLHANAFTRDLAALGFAVYEGHAAEHIAGADLLVISSAVPAENPEVTAARAAGIPVLLRRDLLGELMAGQVGIAVAGTHGKTTTTALLAHTLIEARRDPTYIVGGVMLNTGTNAGVGHGAPFVIEADEYDRMFLGLRPQIAVVTNIEHDHPDRYPTLDDMLAAFAAFVDRLPDDGLLVVCADDPHAAALGAARRAAGKPVVTYGLTPPPDPLPVNGEGELVENVSPPLHRMERGAGGEVNWSADDLRPDVSGGMAFTAFRSGQRLGPMRLNLPGAFNVQNALVVLAVTDHLGVPFEHSAAAFQTFLGTSRRSEILGQAGGVTVVSDYAHHPTAIRVTLAAHRDRPFVRHLWAVWQPHTYGRMRALADAFGSAFAAADHVLVTDVYSVREQFSPGLDAPGMVNSIQHPDARYSGGLETTAHMLAQEVRPGDWVLILSAGDAPQIGTRLLEYLNTPGEA